MLTLLMLNNPKKLIGLALLSVGGIDLLVGNTDKQILPDFLANVLTQQIDMVLVAAGVYFMFIA